MKAKEYVMGLRTKSMFLLECGADHGGNEMSRSSVEISVKDMN